MLITEVACLAKSLNNWASKVADAAGLQEIKVVPFSRFLDRN